MGARPPRVPETTVCSVMPLREAPESVLIAPHARESRSVNGATLDRIANPGRRYFRLRSTNSAMRRIPARIAALDAAKLKRMCLSSSGTRLPK